MTPGRDRIVLVSGLIVTVITALLSVYRPSVVERLDYSVYDALLRSAPLRPPSGRVAIVDVDERSLAAVGQWPWGRDVVGELIGRLRGLGASTIGLDMIFAESDRYGPGRATDQALAVALRAGGGILGYALTFDEINMGPVSCLLHPLGLAVVRPA